MNNNIEFNLICSKAPAPLKAINEISSYEQPSKYIVSSTQYNDSYSTPVLTAGQTFILGYTDETENIYPASKENPVIIFDDFTGAFKWVDFSFKVKSSAMKIIKAKEDTVLIRYLYHMMRKINFSSDEHKRLWLSKYSLFKILVPPLPVQEKIVEVLDTFTEYEAELEAELKARKKQYEYYCDSLLTFDDIPRVELSTVIKSLNTGLNPRKFFKLNTDDATNYYVTIRELQNNMVIVSEKTDRINDEALKLCNNRSNLEVGDVLFSGTGTIGEMAIIDTPPVNWNIKEGVYTIKPIQEKLNSKFLMYLLRTPNIRAAIMKKVAGGTVKSISMGEMRKLIIPLPTIEQQERIVVLLDQFDTLCNDITKGLSAEIAAVRKQYEYYRDLLLTFPEEIISA